VTFQNETNQRELVKTVFLFLVLALLIISRRGGVMAVEMALDTSNEVARVIVLLAELPGWVNLVDSQGRTPLQRAAVEGRTNLVTALFASRVDINAVDKRSMTPLNLAAQKSQLGVATILVAHHADAGLKY